VGWRAGAGCRWRRQRGRHGRQVEPTGLLGADQHLADLAVVERGVQLGQHADAHPVLGLRVDGTAQRVACDTQVLVHEV
jgi:hypothetical protein